MKLSEIEALIASGSEMAHSDFSLGRHIYSVAHDMIVKCGPTVREGDGLAAQFVAENTSIPVPKVHAIVTGIPRTLRIGRSTFIVQDRIPGCPLLDVLDSQDAASIAGQLCSVLAEMAVLNGLAPPSGALGVFGGSFAECSFFRQWENHQDRMPTTTEEFIGYFVDKAKPGLGERRCQELVKSFDYSMPPIFSHGDFVPDNIMMKDGQVTGIIDWESAGWYPYFWNVVLMERVARQPDRQGRPTRWREIVTEMKLPFQTETDGFLEILWNADIFG